MVRVLYTSLTTLFHQIFLRIRLNFLMEFISSARNMINFRFRVFQVMNLYNKVFIIFFSLYNSDIQRYWETFMWYCCIHDIWKCFPYQILVPSRLDFWKSKYNCCYGWSNGVYLTLKVRFLRTPKRVLFYDPKKYHLKVFHSH